MKDYVDFHNYTQVWVLSNTSWAHCMKYFVWARELCMPSRPKTCKQNAIQKKCICCHFMLSFKQLQMGCNCYSVHKAPLLPLLVIAYRAKVCSIPNGSLLWWLYLVVNLSTSGVKTQTALYTCEGFFLIRSTERGGPTLNPYHLRWEEPP